MKNITIKNLDDIENITEFIIGCSIFSKKKINNLFNEKDIDSFLYCSDILMNEGYDNFIIDFCDSRNINIPSQKDLDDSYKKVENTSINIINNIKFIIDKIGFITCKQYLNLIENNK